MGPHNTMKFSILASGLLACLSPLVSATALTYKLGANEKACFFSNIENKLSGQLSTITRNQKYFRTRENRNFSTVRSTERRIFNFSVIESLMMVCMAGLQVFIVRFFFQGARKGYV